MSIKSLPSIKEFFEVIYSSFSVFINVNFNFCWSFSINSLCLWQNYRHRKKIIKYLWDLRKSTWYNFWKAAGKSNKRIFGNIFGELLKNELYKFTRSNLKFRKTMLVKTVMEFWENPCKEAQKIHKIRIF